MEPITHQPAIEHILAGYANQIGADWDKYRNHVYRVYNYALYLNKGEDAEMLAIAAAFHDIGIWTHHTFDYLNPSVELAVEYVTAQKLSAIDKATLTDIINLHHKIRPITHSAVANHFRKADIADLTFGLLSIGLPRAYRQGVNKAFPTKGFHLFLIFQTLKRSLRHPLSPLPMFKW